MTPERASEFAASIYDGHPAAAPLLLEMKNSTCAETRRRARFALLALDPMMPLPHRWPAPVDPLARWRETPAERFAVSVVDLVLVSLLCTDKTVRTEAADLVDQVLGMSATLARAAARSNIEGAEPAICRQ